MDKSQRLSEFIANSDFSAVKKTLAGCFDHRKTIYQKTTSNKCNLSQNILSHFSSAKVCIVRTIRSSKDYLKSLSLRDACCIFTPALVSTLPNTVKELLLNRLLTHEGFQMLLDVAFKIDSAVINPALSYIGLDIRYILTDLPIMDHAFYPKPAETSRAIIGWLTDSVAGRVFSCALVSSLIMSGIETYREIRDIQKAHTVNSDLIGKEAINARINNYRSLAEKEVVGKNDLKGLIISAVIASVFAGPLAGIVSTAVANGAKFGIRKLSRLYCQRQLQKLEKEMAQAIAKEGKHLEIDRVPVRAVIDDDEKTIKSEVPYSETEPSQELMPFDEDTLGDVSEEEPSEFNAEQEMNKIINDLSKLIKSI